MGRRFGNAARFAAALRDAGISEIMFSLDGPREIHDAYRRCSGLYDRVIRAVAAARAAGIRCDVSIVLRKGLEKNDRFFQDVMKIFELPDDPRSMARKSKKTVRTGVLIEPEYDFGNAGKPIAERHSAPYAIDRLEEFQGSCKGIMHGMKLSIRANGEVEPCTIGTMGKGYGNIHNEPFPTIVNKMRASPVYRMFESGTFVNYLPYFSRSLFGSRFFHSCTFFGIISSVAAGVEQLRAQDELNQESVSELNLRIAQEMGFTDT
jgi:MoaA/NifB/PqqE/SkfB family radical SAM enzyme